MSDPGGSHLVIEKGGQLWAVPGGAVERLERGGGRLAVHLSSPPAGSPAAGATSGGSGGELFADRLIAVAAGLAVQPPPQALARFWREVSLGLAMFARRPVVVVDPERPPRTLMQHGAEDGDD